MNTEQPAATCHIQEQVAVTSLLIMATRFLSTLFVSPNDFQRRADPLIPLSFPLIPIFHSEALHFHHS